MSEYIFKIADQEHEFEQIHKLNYETFVEEIPQHEMNSSRSLVDKFHDENTYIICTRDDELIGMVAIRDKRPFSLDHKLDNLDEYLPGVRGGICEVRLLSIKKTSRYKKILKGLIKQITDYCKKRNYSLAVISATTRQLNFYKKVGFSQFGPVVGTNGATYQPMYITVDSYDEFIKKSKIFEMSQSLKYAYSSRETLFLLPGPVGVKSEVKREFERPPVSHRSRDFVKDFNNTSDKLCSLVNSTNAELLMGSGTLANDAIAAQLSLLGGRGILLSNGEFGDRLKDHATRFKLDFDIIKEDWGRCFSKQQIRKYVGGGGYEWAWMVHCETSTGLLNDIDFMKKLCSENNVKLCLDCISSIGNVPIDLQGVFFASGVSGKGIGSYPGLCFVFYNHDIESTNSSLPRYLDLGYFSVSEGVPFTFSSNHLYALKRSLELLDVRLKFDYTGRVSSNIRSKLRSIGLKVFGNDEICSPAVITFQLPRELNSEAFGAELEKNGYLLSYRSEYLLERNLMQIALMGEFRESGINNLLQLIETMLGDSQLANLSL